MDEYILFLDESNKTSNNPYFCLAGFIVKRKDYEEIITTEINTLKEKYEIKHNCPLHYTDIKNGKNEFKKFKQDPNLRNRFMGDFLNIVRINNVTTIGVYVNVSQIKNIINYKETPIYDLLFFSIIDQYLDFLRINNGVGTIVIESRTFSENSTLQDTYYRFLTNGSILFSSKMATTHLKSLGFIIKGESSPGLEIADFIPVAFLRYVNKFNDTYGMYKVVCDKLYRRNTEFQNLLGLKNYLYN